VNFKSKLPRNLQKYASFGVIPKLFLAPFAILTVLVFVLARPFIIIQVHKVKDWRLGHFAINTEILRIKTRNFNQKQPNRLLTICYFGRKQASNSFLAEMFKRELPSVSGHWGWLINELTEKIPCLNSTNESDDYDTEGFLFLNKEVMRFKDSEEEKGMKFLERHCESKHFVCLVVRDPEFFSQTRKRDMSYHDYRNSSIDTYLAAAEALAEMGYTVFRMGAIVKEPLKSTHPRVIDYATNGMRTEFLDIFLGAHCKFCVTSGTGWNSVATIFHRPVLSANTLPILHRGTVGFDSLLFPKILSDKSNPNPLSISSILERDAHALLSNQAYKDAGVVIRNLSSEELVDAVTEMAQRVEGTFVETPEQIEMQAKAKQILSTHPKLQPSPNYYPIRAQFASCFLSRYPNFLD